MIFILFVLNNSECLEDLLSAWEDLGVTGITILPSTGLGRVRRSRALREDLPIFPSITDLMEHEEELNRTLFTVVDDDTMVEKIIDVTQKVVGDLSQPHTGILITMPVSQAYGLNKTKKK